MRPIKEVEQTVAMWNQWCKGARPENPGRVSGLIRDQLMRAWVANRTISIITQWCLSIMLMQRAIDPKHLALNNAEEKTISDIAKMVQRLTSLGWRVDWLVALSPSSLPSGKLPDAWAARYQALLNGARARFDEEEAPSICIIDRWDQFVSLPDPDAECIERITELVVPNSIRYECDRRRSWAEKAGLSMTEAAIVRDVRYQIAWEALEGEIIARECSDWILVPLEWTERYRFHTMLIPDFQRRLLPILRPYPWR